MDRRQFIQAMAAAGLISGFQSNVHSIEEAEKMMAENRQPIERRPYGKHGDNISILGFGGIIVMNATPEDSANHVAEAVDRGINYFDVAPAYGNAEERLGPALNPYRDKCFLACKTGRRDAEGAEQELNRSLELARTDHFDLYQMHAITTMEDVEKAFAPGGVMELFVKARDEGKVRHLGFSAHSDEAAQAAMERFDFDSILFPFNFATWIKGGFGPTTHEMAKEKGVTMLALKAMAHQQWPQDIKPDERRWNKAWYQPLDRLEKVNLGLRFTLHLPVTAAVPPGHWELFQMAMDLAQSGALASPLNGEEEQKVARLAEQANPLFEHKVA